MSKLLRRWKEGLDALLAPAEDPRQAFASAYERQQLALALARRALVDMAATKSQLEARRQEIQGHLPRLEQQAQRALAADQEDLARLALRRRHLAAAELRAIEQHIQELQQREHVLGLHEERLATQTDAFEARVKTIAASYNAAEAQARISEAFNGVSAEMSDLSRALEQVEQQTEHMYARAVAIETSVEDDQIELELAAIKRRLEQAGAARA